MFAPETSTVGIRGLSRSRSSMLTFDVMPTCTWPARPPKPARPHFGLDVRAPTAYRSSSATGRRWRRRLIRVHVHVTVRTVRLGVWEALASLGAARKELACCWTLAHT